MRQQKRQRNGGRRRWLLGAIGVVGALGAAPLVATPLGAQQSDEEWLAQCREHDGDRWDGRRSERFCEVRIERLRPRGRLAVDGSQNGGVAVRGVDGDGVVVHARVSAQDETAAAAQALAREVRIVTANDSVHAIGPERDGRRHWSVSYVVEVPRRQDLTVTARNGGVRVDGVTGRLELDTHNGGLSLTDVGGDVRARTYNGGLRVALAGRRWEGRGLDAETRNGGVQIELPDGYAAHLETETVNGGMRSEIPITVQGRVGRRLSVDLNGGGPTVRATTHNGGVQIRRR
jgi:hypothetical protein